MDDFSPDEKNLALSQGLLGLGAGLLSGSFGHYGAFGPALGAGISGFQTANQNFTTNMLHQKMFKQQKMLQDAQIGNYNSEVQKRTAEQAEKDRVAKLALGADQFATGSGPTTAPGPMVPSSVGKVQNNMGGVMVGNAPAVTNDAAIQPQPLAPQDPSMMPTVNVTAKTQSNLLNPDWHMARAAYLYKNGDPKGAVEAVTQAQKLRDEERKITKEDESKPLEGVPGVLYNPKTGKYLKDGAPISGDEVQQMKLNIAAAGASKIVNNLTQSAEKSYGTAFSGKVADSDVALREAAMAAPQNADRANRILDLVNSGKVITGSGADYRLVLGKALGIAGLSDKETITKTEGLTSELASATLDSIKTSGLGSGQGFTDKDREFLEKAKAGNIQLEAGTIARLAELNHKAAVASADKWNTRVKMIPQSALDGTGVTRDPIVVPPMRGKTKAMLPDGWSIQEVR